MLVGLFGLFLFTIAGSIAFGSKPIHPSVIFDAIFEFDPENSDQIILLGLRVPRTIIGIMVGSALAVAGGTMQAITRNPLADPGLLGVNAGASFFVVLGIWVFGISNSKDFIWLAMGGAAIVSVAVYFLGTLGRGGATPVRLALAGAAFSALLLAGVRGVIILSEEALNIYRFWVVGSIGQTGLDEAVYLAPFVIVGGVLAMLMTNALNAMALGDASAKALGIPFNTIRIMAVSSVTLLCGATVALAGPVGFVGLVVPHIARGLCGPDQRWMIWFNLLLGPILLLWADIIGRVLFAHSEIEVGIVIALIGGPAFIYFVRNFRIAQL